jgi:hypothetical protein
MKVVSHFTARREQYEAGSFFVTRPVEIRREGKWNSADEENPANFSSIRD